MMNLNPDQRAAGKACFDAEVSRRNFLKAGVATGVVAGGGLGAFYFGYEKALGSPVRVGVIGTGDEGNILLGAINPEFLEVKAICDIRPYNRFRAFHGEVGQPLRPGLISVYHWKSEAEALRHVSVYKGSYEELLANAKRDGLEAVIIALPLHLHAPAAVAAMRAGLHVITEKLMGHTVHECKEMARTAQETKRYLATGHQRHYNILYANAMDTIQRGILGELHYIRAQWHRGNLPGKDSWQQPLPPGVKDENNDPKTNKLSKELEACEKELAKASGSAIDRLEKQIAQVKAQIEDEILHKKDESGKTKAELLGYERKVIKDASGKVIYDRPAIEELIRWRLWDRTGAGLMAELGSHQLDASSIFVSAMKGSKTQHPHPLNVVAAANRPIFPADRDVEDHVYCVIEFPTPEYDAKDDFARRKKIAVQYASINGNGFGGYGEIVYGTKGTLILEREQEVMLFKGPAAASTIKVSGGAGGPTMDTQASGAAHPSAASSSGKEAPVSKGYAEELEHWAWCIRHPAPQNQPRCRPEVALGDAVIALVTNMAARQGKRIEFKEEWFDIDSDDTPEDVKPDLTRYQA
ncbi:MAG: Gfo/Idh/MocA family oxidoreductase [Thermoguttaceae bacterium]|jgi:predicted dehydrogenase